MKDYLKQKFFETFFVDAEKYISCGGRFEVLGNHTDHNHGLCIAATCSLSIYAAIRKRDDNIIRFYSEGFSYTKIDLSKLSKQKAEIGKSSALIRGIAYYLSKQYKVGGFDLYSRSEVPAGAGVSSSAATLQAQTSHLASVGGGNIGNDTTHNNILDGMAVRARHGCNLLTE